MYKISDDDILSPVSSFVVITCHCHVHRYFQIFYENWIDVKQTMGMEKPNGRNKKKNQSVAATAAAAATAAVVTTIIRESNDLPPSWLNLKTSTSPSPKRIIQIDKRQQHATSSNQLVSQSLVIIKKKIGSYTFNTNLLRLSIYLELI
ncbi:hypothetical protein DFA_11818 [Cavenderia fasciculata]|uniref:Uncharacterized protein n=1 Tax=Cavenderia fasciculata TaxID=261658 RepID=F4QEA8_CACFS|nr:uncharacterized protein DFA_11818 [Cavenderia fasciculata]EGG14055.1 hypothetical protein DFA_11818 [Cavenderia fasciculata]|eukprot:XP_004350763.1 hypothetical protein DFA_11818 [Cavenderia fasciculata]